MRRRGPGGRQRRRGVMAAGMVLRGLRRGRITRRQVLGAGGSAVALAIAGCGGSNNSGGSSGSSGSAAPAAGGATQAAQATTTGAPKPGGTITFASLTDPATFDPYTNLAYNAQEFASTVYSRVLKLKTGPGIGPSDLVLTTDVAAA